MLLLCHIFIWEEKAQQLLNGGFLFFGDRECLMFLLHRCDLHSAPITVTVSCWILASNKKITCYFLSHLKIAIVEVNHCFQASVLFLFFCYCPTFRSALEKCQSGMLSSWQRWQAKLICAVCLWLRGRKGKKLLIAESRVLSNDSFAILYKTVCDQV